MGDRRPGHRPQGFVGRSSSRWPRHHPRPRDRVEPLGEAGALAAINGGYFGIGSANSTDGDLAGLSIIGGRLVSKAVNDRTSLLVPSPDGRARAEALRTDEIVRCSDGASRELDGLNREP